MRCREAILAAFWAVFAQTSLAAVKLGPVEARFFAAAPNLAIAATAANKISVYEMPSGALLQTMASAGQVVDVTAGPNGAAWLSKTPQGPLVTVRLATGKTASSLVPEDIPAERIAWLGKAVAVLHDQGGDLWEPVTGAWLPPDRVLSAEAAPLFDESYIQSSPNGLVAFIKPYRLGEFPEGKRTMSSVTMFQNAGDSWKMLGTAVTTAPRYEKIRGAKFDGQGRYVEAAFDMSSPRIAIDDKGFVALEDKAVLSVPFLESTWAPDRRPVKGPLPAWSEQIAASGGRIWRLANGRLYSQNLATNQLDSYVPWNLKGALNGIRTDGKAIWVLTSAGPRVIEDGVPSIDGYGGFVRTPTETGDLTDLQSRLMSELDSWIGVPYVLGGNTKQGVDCSGLVVQAYLSLGISLPRTSSQLRTTKLGKTVTDDLQVGDVICVPGHVAIYAGGGTTIEAVRGGVRKLSIWRFKDVVVKRFLDLAASN